jgi:hypothetical protein
VTGAEVAAEPPIIDVEPIDAPVETVTVEEEPIRKGARKRKRAGSGAKRKAGATKNVGPKPRARRGRGKSEAADKATQIA